jgi:hypothetical protein
MGYRLLPQGPLPGRYPLQHHLPAVSFRCTHISWKEEDSRGAPLSRCWDGKNLDSPDHRAHVAHTVGTPPAFPTVSGKCPASHPVKIPQLMYEVNWDTSGFFSDLKEWPEDGSQPLVLSNGDT